MSQEFIVARNPQRLSKMPYLLCLPLRTGDLWQKATQTWPRAIRVYCHAFEGVPPRVSSLDVIERTRVLVCERRGRAIDLVLDRGANKRSQFVFTTSKGRPLIFWQSAISAKSARPGLRIPGNASPQNMVIYVDGRERYGYTFAGRNVRAERRTLAVGDYAVILAESVIAVVERKTLVNFIKSLVDGSLALEMAELDSVPNAAVVVEGCYSAILRHGFTTTGFLPTLIARLAVRYPRVSINFIESRKLAEEFAFRYLCAALAAASYGQLPLPVASP